MSFRLPSPTVRISDDAGILTTSWAQSLKVLEAGSVDLVAFSSLPADPLSPKARSPLLYVVTDGLKQGETTGAGTGCLAYWDGSAWCRASDDSPLAI